MHLGHQILKMNVYDLLNPIMLNFFDVPNAFDITKKLT